MNRHLALPLGAALALVIAGQAAAGTWSTPQPIGGSSAFANGGLAPTGPTSAVLVYEDNPGSANRIYITRTSDSGANWSVPVALTANSAGATNGRASADGNDVDVVYLAGTKCNQPLATDPCRVWYRHSTDGGATFSSAVALSPASNHAVFPTLARGDNGRVAVAWSDHQLHLKVRVSKNGGATFGEATTLGSAQWGTALAVGGGLIYAAYAPQLSGNTTLLVRTTNDDGAHWSSAVKLTKGGGLFASIAVSGSTAYVGYDVTNAKGHMTARYRRTTNGGKTWQAYVNLSSPSGMASEEPGMVIDGSGTVHTIFDRCLDARCNNSQQMALGNEAVFYRSSSDGTTWSSTDQVSPGNNDDELGLNLAVAGSTVIVVYDAWLTDYANRSGMAVTTRP